MDPYMYMMLDLIHLQYMGILMNLVMMYNIGFLGHDEIIKRDNEWTLMVYKFSWAGVGAMDTNPVLSAYAGLLATPHSDHWVLFKLVVCENT